MKLRRVSALLCPVFISLLSTSPTAAQGVPHLEQCTSTEKWDYQGGQFGVKNICDKSVVIQFMTQKDQ